MRPSCHRKTNQCVGLAFATLLAIYVLIFRMRFGFPTVKSPSLTSAVKESCPSKPILTMVRGGRLGNLVGTYSTLYSLAQKYSYHALVPPDVLSELQKYFSNVSLQSTATVPKNCRVIHKIGVPTNTSQLGVNVQLPMYIAQLTAFNPYRDVIVKEFQFQPAILRKAQNFLRGAKQMHKVEMVVGVHIRRTDYIKYIQKRWKDTIVDEHYIHAAMESVSALGNRNTNVNVKGSTLTHSVRFEPLFVVLSDDVLWCKQHLNQTRFPMVFPVKTDNPGVDMAILTLCDHVIISVGSYGFWAAYLSQQNVTYPDKNAPFYKQINDVHLNGWTKFST